MPEIEGSDPVRRLCPIMDGTLQALQLGGRGELGVDVPPLKHQCPKDACIRREKDHRAKVVFGSAGHRVGEGLSQLDH